MCEAHAYMLSGNGEQMLMENVVTIKTDGDALILTDLFGDEIRVEAKIKEIALIGHKIYLEPKEASAA